MRIALCLVNAAERTAEAQSNLGSLDSLSASRMFPGTFSISRDLFDVCDLLQEIWKDLEMSDVVQEQTLQDITQKALGVWNGAVDHAEQHRNNIRDRIDQAAGEMRLIAEQLGDFAEMDDPNSSMVRSPPCGTVQRQETGNQHTS